MKKDKIIKMEMQNGSLVKKITIYESGIVEINNAKTTKKIDVVYDIIKYIETIKKYGFEKSVFDKVCKVEYDGVIYNSGIVYSNIELMIRNNQDIQTINESNKNIRIKQKKEQEERRKKQKNIEQNKNKIIEFYNNRNILDVTTIAENINNDTFDSINFTLIKKEHFALGESRVLSKYIDISNNVEYPKELQFLAQINLSEFSKYDKKNLLPSTGNLYFFQGPMINDEYYECGKVIYSEDSELTRKKVFIYNEDLDLELGIDNIKYKIDSYSSENEKENKIFGIYSDPQLNELDILKVSNEYIILLQLGWDIYGEGVITFLIKETDLKNKNFNNIIYTYSQT